MSKRAPTTKTKTPAAPKPIIPPPATKNKATAYIMAGTVHSSNPGYVDHKGCSSLDKCIKIAEKKQRSKPQINYKKMFG